tara:strand:- start:87 stop:392 length:306 start_codon:yes stop_codon:yes gene_type:complete
MNLKMITCPKCNGNMPELRLTQYGYNFCVECSTVGTKRGVPVQMGQGDHTWTETLIMDEDVYKKYAEEISSQKPEPKLEDDHPDLKGRNVQGPLKIINRNS